MEETKYDAVLVRLYWLSQRGDDGIVRPSLRTRFADRAAYLLYKNKIVKNLVLAAGSVWGSEYPSFAELAKKDLIIYGVPEQAIHVQATAASTLDETKVLLDMAYTNHWTRLGDVSFRTHMHTIRHVNKGRDITPFIVEDVVEKYDDRQVIDLSRRLSRSIYELGFWLYEMQVLLALRMVGGDYERLTEMGRSRRVKKRHNTLLIPFPQIGLPMDKYNL